MAKSITRQEEPGMTPWDNSIRWIKAEITDTMVLISSMVPIDHPPTTILRDKIDTKKGMRLILIPRTSQANLNMDKLWITSKLTLNQMLSHKKEGQERLMPKNPLRKTLGLKIQCGEKLTNQPEKEQPQMELVPITSKVGDRAWFSSQLLFREDSKTIKPWIDPRISPLGRPLICMTTSIKSIKAEMVNLHST